MKLSKEEVLLKYDKIKAFLNASEELTGQQKEDLATLFEHLETQTGWLTAPCSTRFHCSYEGGLLEHSLNVVNTVLKIKRTLAPDITDASAIIVGLLHDAGKYCHYIRKEATARQQQFGYPGSITVNKNVPYMNHEDRSLWVISKFYDLTEEEFSAIALHNVFFRTDDNSFFDAGKLTGLLAMADFWSCVWVDTPGE